MVADYDTFQKLFEYLSAPVLPDKAYRTYATGCPVIVFGRKDPLVACAAAGLAKSRLAQAIVITGGIGKDSGDIGSPRSPYRSEAHFLDAALKGCADEMGVALPPVTLEEQARHGGENAEFALRLLVGDGFALENLICVAHAASCRRLAATLDFKARTLFGTTPAIYRVPTDYAFNPANPADQKEAAGEMLRLADWPAQGMLHEQPDLPCDLVAFARAHAG